MRCTQFYWLWRSDSDKIKTTFPFTWWGSPMNINKHCSHVQKISKYGHRNYPCMARVFSFVGSLWPTSRWLVSSCHVSQFGLPIGNRSQHEHIFGNLCFWFKYSESSRWTTVIWLVKACHICPFGGNRKQKLKVNSVHVWPFVNVNTSVNKFQCLAYVLSQVRAPAKPPKDHQCLP